MQPSRPRAAARVKRAGTVTPRASGGWTGRAAPMKRFEGPERPPASRQGSTMTTYHLPGNVTAVSRTLQQMSPAQRLQLMQALNLAQARVANAVAQITAATQVMSAPGQDAYDLGMNFAAAVR